MTAPFPDRPWGSRTGLLGRTVSVFAATGAGSALVRALGPLDRRILQRTAGRYTALGPVGAPALLLTTTGRRSGQPRTTPLLYAHAGDVLYLIGSNFGGEHHPAWTSNLLAHPEAVITIAGERIPVHTELLQDAERKAEVFAQFEQISQAYTAYRGRTSRELRIFAVRRS
ncbi:nitroreductase/quinone reductase family protein [Nocardia jiangxiensis]|uniref:nitroreductase/quinone reductase family protein n=1 Tax=Nocardia jiangxiensis TaxID=282685 RepID=UPI0002D785F4|nr:nitroreductase/quinone reductase family protein [Nocardia jiangxiensis]